MAECEFLTWLATVRRRALTLQANLLERLGDIVVNFHSGIRRRRLTRSTLPGLGVSRTVAKTFAMFEFVLFR